MTSTRLLVGIVGLSILLPAVFLGGPMGTWVVVAIALAIAIDEYARMAFSGQPWPARLGLAVGLAAVVAPAIAGADDLAAGGVGLGVVGAGIVVTLWPGETLEGAADRLGRVLVGLSWIGLMSFLIRLRALPDGVVWVLLALGISWAADTGAYFAGRRFGRTKLYPRVSPNKTWEGLVGGLLGSVLWVAGMQAAALSHVSWLDVLVLAPLASAAGVLGDLTQSMLKRSYGVKDMGNILPGHGGMLDRIDSVLFVAPVVWSWHIVVYGS